MFSTQYLKPFFPILKRPTDFYWTDCYVRRVASQGLLGLWTADFQIRGKRETESTGVRVIAIHSQFVTHSVNKDMNLSKLQVMGRDREAVLQPVGSRRVQTQLGN